MIEHFLLSGHAGLAIVDRARASVTLTTFALGATYRLGGQFAADAETVLVAKAQLASRPRRSEMTPEDAPAPLAVAAARARLTRLAALGRPEARLLLLLLDAPDVRPADPRSLLFRDRLGTCFLELTGRCNERCEHCYAESGPEVETALSLSTLEGVVDDAHAVGFPALQFTGGDPLISPALLPLARRAAALDFARLEVYTNALALDPPLLDALLDCGCRFAVSLYSHDAQTHDAITRVPGSHARTSANVRRAIERGAIVRIGGVITEAARDHVEQAFAYARDVLGVEPARIGFDVVHSVGRGRRTPDLTLSDAPGARHIHGAPGAPAKSAESKTTKDDDTHDVPERTHDTPTAPPGGPPWSGKLAVAPTGEVFPCIFSRFVTLGRVPERRLRAIVEEPRPTVTSEFAALAASGDGPAVWSAMEERLQCADCRVGVTALLLALAESAPLAERLRVAAGTSEAPAEAIP